MKQTFAKETLIDLLADDSDEYQIVSDEIVENSRWSILHELIFKSRDEEKFFRTSYSVGATEQQDEYPFEYADEEIECDVVEPVEKTVIVYRRVKG